MVTGADVSSKPLEVGTGLILGRVVEAGTTTAVPDAMVTLTGAALGVSGQRFTNGVAAGQRVTVADNTGRFLFRDLPVGNYQITAAAQGFSSAGYQQAKPNQGGDGRSICRDRSSSPPVRNGATLSSVSGGTLASPARS